MANLYKKPVVRTDPKTGKKVKTRSKKWWGRYRDAAGRERRVPLASDKAAAQTMLNELVRNVEREKSGQVSPFEHWHKRPLRDHILDFQQFQKGKGNSEKHVSSTVDKVRSIVTACKWAYISDISASGVQRQLADRRNEGLSIATSNHYLRAVKQFSRWLVRDRRTDDDRLAHLSMLNKDVDRRRERRALSQSELELLINAAVAGPRIESMAGPDRAMMYAVAAWTGYRKAEIGSLTRNSLQLDSIPPTATVSAAYSKRKREDVQVLHPAIVDQLRTWLQIKTDTDSTSPLFPVSGKVPGGTERKTSKMMKMDLHAARMKWIADAENDPAEQEHREDSDFLRYCDSQGRYADFHANRHTFITNLEHAGVSPRMAQSLARHSDIRLTMGVYTHVGLHDQTAAIQSLPSPPGTSVGQENNEVALRATGTDGSERPATMNENAPAEVPTMVPIGAENGAQRVAPKTMQFVPDRTEAHPKRTDSVTGQRCPKALARRTFRTSSHESASQRTATETEKPKARPGGFEPPTCGLEVRCSIQLSYGRWGNRPPYFQGLPDVLSNHIKALRSNDTP